MRKLANLGLRGRVRLALSLSALLVAGWAASVALNAYRVERRAFLPSRHAPRLSVAQFEIEGLTPVTFPSRSRDTLSAYYAPPRNGAVIVLCHGSQGERSDLVAEARLLAQAGFGVLAMDWPGHGESAGTIEWGQPERLALQGALDFLSTRSGVDANRLGALGFSMGGFIVTQVAAHDPRLRAVALAGTPHDALEHTRWEYRRLGFLRRGPASLAQRVSKLNTTDLVPVREIGKISPRQVMLISGSNDEHVPRWITERMFRAAGEPKRWLQIEGAGHGGYFEADARRYGSSLVAFFGTLSDAAATSASGTPAP